MQTQNKLEQHHVHIYFTTCTTREAVDEINIMLKNANYLPINETQLINSEHSKHEDDWFDDYDFTFETILPGTKSEINEKLSNVCLSFEIRDWVVKHMTKQKLLNKIDAYQYAIRTNNTEWTNSILNYFEYENCHKIIPLLQNNKFEEAKQFIRNMFEKA